MHFRASVSVFNTDLKRKTYLTYGLRIESFIPLPILITGDVENNVRIQKGSVRTSRRYKDFDESAVIHKPEIGLSARPAKDYFIIEWHGFGACLIENGSEVTIEIDSGVQEDDIVPFITGPILAVVLHQREKLVLHASAVKVHDKAALFLGNKGYGKSTLAAHLQVRGHQLLSDDLVPITFLDGAAQTLPGYPQIRLFPDSVESIGKDPFSLPLVNTQLDKRYLNTSGEFSTDPVSIGCIFVLQASRKINVERIRSSAAFMEIAHNTFMGSYLSETENTSAHFKQCQSLVTAAPIFTLGRLFDFRRMPEVIKLVEQTVSESNY